MSEMKGNEIKWKGLGKSGLLDVQVRENGMEWEKVRMNEMKLEKEEIIDIKLLEEIKNGR